MNRWLTVCVFTLVPFDSNLFVSAVSIQLLCFVSKHVQAEFASVNLLSSKMKALVALIYVKISKLTFWNYRTTFIVLLAWEIGSKS